MRGATGRRENSKNPTDRAKLGSKIHILVDQRGAPLAIDISGANQHDKWSVKNLVFHIAAPRPGTEQHFCGDKGYDYDDVRQLVNQAGYVAHIKRKRNAASQPRSVSGARRNPVPSTALGGRTYFGLVSETTQRAHAFRCKKSTNWLAFVQFACASILCDMTIFG